MFMWLPRRYRTKAGDACPFFDNGGQRIMAALKRRFHSGDAVTFSIADAWRDRTGWGPSGPANLGANASQLRMAMDLASNDTVVARLLAGNSVRTELAPHYV
jgi:hypothetical protein